MKFINRLRMVPLGKRYSLGWRVIGMVFSMYLALELFLRFLKFLGQLAQDFDAWQIPVNQTLGVWIFLIGFLAVAPPIASVFLGIFFPLERLLDHDE
jgi:hypothetical protein